MIEIESSEPYVLYKTNATGAYVGEIRTAVEEILTDIAKLEFLWTKFPDNAVWRRKDNRKWYGAILTVSGEKIGLDTEKIVEIIDLRMETAQKDNILSREHYYPGWHMNKKSWYTLVLDDSITDEEIKQRIIESYELAK